MKQLTWEAAGGGRGYDINNFLGEELVSSAVIYCLLIVPLQFLVYLLLLLLLSFCLFDDNYVRSYGWLALR